MGNGLLAILGWTVAFAITAVVGGWVAESYQRRNWLFQQRVMSAKERYERNSALVERLVSLVKLRIDASNQYLDVLKGGDNDAIRSERDRYRVVADRWTSEAPALVDAVKKSIRRSKGEEFNQYFFPEFKSVDTNLRKIRVAVQDRLDVPWEAARACDGILYLMEFRIEDFSLDIDYILSEEKLIIDQKPRISHENRDILSYSYLFKSLFDLRPNF